jgi:hypothetical protein
MTNSDLRRKLEAFAEDLMTKAKAEGVKLEEAVKVFKEVRELLYILTPPTEPGDKARGRRSTMAGMRQRIAGAGGAPNGRAEPTI